MIRRGVLQMLAFVALAVTGAILAFAAPAQATDRPLALSADGVTFGDALPSSVFAGAAIVPGTTVTRTFWVKNQTTMPGNLAVALRDVAGGDAQLIAAITLRVIAGPDSGVPVPLVSAKPCRSLISGVSLPAGGTMQVDVELRLSNSLAHRSAQGSAGSFMLPVTLTSTDVRAPDGCSVMTPVDPPSGHGGGTPPNGMPPGTIGTAVVSGAADGTVLPTLGDGPMSGLGGKGAVRGDIVLPNTGRFWQELDIVGYLIALVLGGIFAWWRRRRPHEEETYA